MKLYIACLVASFWAFSIAAQDEANQWWIGYSSAGGTDPRFSIISIDFNLERPGIVAEYDQDIFLEGTNALMCGRDKKMLLSTNGMQVWMNDYGSVIDTIAYGSYWESNSGSRPFGFPKFNGAIILPIPNETEESYSILYHDALIDPQSTYQLTKILESRISMNDEIPTVLYQDSVIAPFHKWYHPGISAIRHANGRDWWIIVFERSSHLYYRYLLDPRGIVNMGIDSISESLRSGLAYQNFSPSGNYFMRYDATTIAEGQFISLFSFDRCEGKMTFLYKLHTSTGVFCGPAFSPSEQFMYVDNADTLWQFDLWAQDVHGSKTLIDINKRFTWPGWLSEGFGPMCTAIDERIYMISSNGGSHSLSVINRPDEPGVSCRFIQNEIILPTYTSRSPPNVANFRIGPVDGSTCDTLGLNNQPVSSWRWELQDSTDENTIRFTDLSYFRPENWHWDFDDGITSDLSDPIHHYESPGWYHVCLTVSNEYATDSMCRWIEVKDITSTYHPGSGQDQDFTVYPNPFDDYLEITPSADGYHLLDLSLANVHGQTVISHPMTFPGRINIGHLPAGIYFLNLKENGILRFRASVMKVD